MSGGTINTDYELLNHIVCSDGQEQDNSILIKVRDVVYPTLNATVSGASANSYVTRAEADSYFATRLYATDWTGATTADKERALIMATARIDQELFIGTRTVAAQALKWPRFDVQIPGESGGYAPFGSYYGSYYATDAIPKVVKDAQCEYALLIMGSDVLAQSGLSNFKRVKVGPVEVELASTIQSGVIPADVSRLLNGLRLGSSGAAIMRA